MLPDTIKTKDDAYSVSLWIADRLNTCQGTVITIERPGREAIRISKQENQVRMHVSGAGRLSPNFTPIELADFVVWPERKAFNRWLQSRRQASEHPTTLLVPAA